MLYIQAVIADDNAVMVSNENLKVLAGDVYVEGDKVASIKIIHCRVAIQIRTYFEKPHRYTRHMHPLSYRQIHTSAT